MIFERRETSEVHLSMVSNCLGFLLWAHSYSEAGSGPDVQQQFWWAKEASVLGHWNEAARICDKIAVNLECM